MFNFIIEGSEVVTLEYKSMYYWLKDVTCTCFPPSAPYLGLAAASKRENWITETFKAKEFCCG